jgi:hypothetical protein
MKTLVTKVIFGNNNHFPINDLEYVPLHSFFMPIFAQPRLTQNKLPIKKLFDVSLSETKYAQVKNLGFFHVYGDSLVQVLDNNKLNILFTLVTDKAFNEQQKKAIDNNEIIREHIKFVVRKSFLESGLNSKTLHSTIKKLVKAAKENGIKVEIVDNFKFVFDSILPKFNTLKEMKKFKQELIENL